MQLDIINVSKKYGDFFALQKVDIKLENGIYGLIGPNGAGKTTLINIILGLTEMDDGEILSDCKKIRDYGDAFYKRVGYLPQYPQFYKNFTGKEFLDYMCCIKNIKKTYRKNRIDEVLRDVNLVEQKKKKIKELSGGMRQRLGIAQALLNNPQILILDEPTAGLDPGERIRFRNIITEAAKDRMILVATHIVSDIEYIANHIIMLQKGNVACEGTAEELREKINGQVFAMRVSEKEAESIRRNYLVSNMRREDNFQELVKNKKIITVQYSTDINNLPFSGKSIKFYPLKHWQKMLSMLKALYPSYTIVQLGVSGNEEMPGVDLRLIGQTSFYEYLVLLQYSALHIAQEGGAAHIRHYLCRKPTVVLFGPTSHKVRGYDENINLRIPTCGLELCEWLDGNRWYENCPKYNDSVCSCLEKISPEMVVETIRNSHILEEENPA